MIYFIKINVIIILGIIILCQSNFRSDITGLSDFSDVENDSWISGVHTLSIHVRDTLTHDSVYQLFHNKLKLPIYYSPVKIGQRKYVGLYAGNMVLEPCGPYQNIDYANDNFKSIFYGLNLEVGKSLESVEQILSDRGIRQQVNKGSIYVRDSILSNENIFVGLYNITDKEKRDSLANFLLKNPVSNPGIEYIKEIDIGYKGEINLLKWKELLDPLEIGENGTCQINDFLQLYFIKGEINEVKGITFKVGSIEKSQQYLMEIDLLSSTSDHKIQLDQTKTFGLTIYLTDDEYSVEY